jgi:PKD repeat protein
MKKIVSQLSAAMLVGALVFTTSCKKPEATVTASKTADVAIGEPVKFSSSEELLKNTQISYDFGDGQRSEGIISPSHAYNAAGTYTVSIEFLRTKNAEKSKGKRTWGTADVTVVAVTPTFEAKDASGAAVTASTRIGQSVSLTNTTVQSAAVQSPISWSWVANGSVVSTAKNFTWTPTTTGKVVIKLMATQGSTSVYSTELTITVSGQDLTVNEMQAMIGGKWNVSSSETYSGAGYASGAPCFGTSPTYTNPYSTINLDSNGGATWNISALTTTSGNLNSGGSSFYVRNSTTIEVSGGSLPNGLYTTTVSATGMTLTKTVKGGSATCPTSDAATITLSR